ncbi:MAG: amidohydrolase [archaeon]|nr:amidohydrolase [archaeon]
MTDEIKGSYTEYANKLEYDPSLLIDINPEKLILDMDEAGIDKTVILALDYGTLFKFKMYKFYNNYVAFIAKKYPDRIIGFAGIDPRRGKEAISELERCVKKGLKGVKLWPLTGFYPDNPEFYPFYKRIEELGLPILCHTGSCPPGTYIKYNRPEYVDTIAVDFPELKIIMAHVSAPYSDAAISISAKNKNVFFDISSLQNLLFNSPYFFYQILIRAKLICGVEKILFGSDWPLFAPIVSQKNWVQAIKNLEVPEQMKIMGVSNFSEEEKNMILGGNAAKILGL